MNEASATAASAVQRLLLHGNILDDIFFNFLVRHEMLPTSLYHEYNNRQKDLNNYLWVGFRFFIIGKKQVSEDEGQLGVDKKVRRNSV